MAATTPSCSTPTGDIIYATRDYSRNLYAYTGEWRYSTDHSAISSDWVREYRFINVTTGEYFWAPVVDKSGDQPYQGGNFEYETYYDLSSGTTSKGYYVASEVTYKDNPYTQQYVIGDFTITEDDNSATAYAHRQQDGLDVYFDTDNILFLVTDGSGEKMTVNEYNGIDEFKKAVGMGNIGTFDIDNAVFTVSNTVTGDKYVDVCFIFGDSYTATMNYVFVPETVYSGDWTTVIGDALGYKWSYDGAYYQGEKIDNVYFTDKIADNGVRLARGFYTYVFKDGNYYLTERIANPENAYYQNVTFTNESVSADRWTFTDGMDKNTALGSEVTIVDIGNKVWEADHKITLTELYTYCDRINSNATLAYTVDPSTNRVDYIYLTTEGWEYTVTVDESIGLNKDWVVVDGTLYDQLMGTITVRNTNKDVTYTTGQKLQFVINGQTFEGTYRADENVFVIGITEALENVPAGIDKIVYLTEVKVPVTIVLADGTDSAPKYYPANWYDAKTEPVMVEYGTALATVPFDRTGSYTGPAGSFNADVSSSTAAAGTWTTITNCPFTENAADMTIDFTSMGTVTVPVTYTVLTITQNV